MNKKQIITMHGVQYQKSFVIKSWENEREVGETDNASYNVGGADNDFIQTRN